MNYVYAFLGIVFVLMISVIFHEYGHCWTSRFFGIPVDEFAIGLGKVLWKKKGKKHDTVYSIRLLPLGGFCSMNDEAFDKLPRWKRAVVLSMGCIHNLILAVVPITLFALVKKGIPGVIGTLKTIGEMIGNVIGVVPSMFHPTPDTVTGPVGLVSTVGDMAAGMTPGQGFMLLVTGITAINVVLAVFNLLPIPALDGGQILFLALDFIYEKITGKLIPKKVIMIINTVFFSAIMGYSIILLFADLWLPLMK